MKYKFVLDGMEIKLLKDGYTPFHATDSPVVEIGIIPNSTNTDQVVSVLQKGPPQRKVCKLECFTTDIIDYKLLEGEMLKGSVLPFSDGITSASCIIKSVALSNNSHSNIWFYTLELLEATAYD